MYALREIWQLDRIQPNLKFIKSHAQTRSKLFRESGVTGDNFQNVIDNMFICHAPILQILGPMSTKKRKKISQKSIDISLEMGRIWVEMTVDHAHSILRTDSFSSVNEI